MRLIKTTFFIFLFFLVGLGLFIGFGYLDSRYGLHRDLILISGTGSMYPTFPKGQGTDSASLSNQTVAQVAMRPFPGGINIYRYHFFQHPLAYGDIVSFENSVTDKITLDKTGHKTGFVKRVIGLPGDKIEIRDGFIWRNTARLLENYTATARSTFGGQFLPDCKSVTIPRSQIFVLGDNRKGSDDSRHNLGLVAISDIDHFLPLAEQTTYSQKWRDASSDASFSLMPLLDENEYLKLLNQKRSENKLSQLKYQPKLDLSSAKRADVMLKYDDLSLTATKSAYTMEKAMTDVGYNNIVWGEAPTLGYYDAAELIENFFEFPDSRKFLLNPDFQETGLSVKVGDLHGCPVQIVVQEFAGYKPPNYPANVISSWQKGLDGLQASLPSWQKLKTYSAFYSAHKSEIDELLDLFSTRISRIQAIVKRMQANQWLTGEETKWTNADEQLAKRLSELTSKINSYQN